MNQKQFYKAQTQLECGKELTHEQQLALMNLCETCITLIEEACEDDGDMFGTEGWEHAIGWD
jgi:hypothetical protein